MQFDTHKNEINLKMKNNFYKIFEGELLGVFLIKYFSSNIFNLFVLSVRFPQSSPGIKWLRFGIIRDGPLFRAQCLRYSRRHLAVHTRSDRTGVDPGCTPTQVSVYKKL